MVNQLKQRLVLSIALIFIVVLTIIMSILYLIMKDAFSSSAKNSAFSISNSVYIAMNETVFDGIEIATFSSKDPFIQTTFFQDESTYQNQLQNYLQNISDIYNFQPVYLCSFMTNTCYGSDGFIQSFATQNSEDAWFFEKKATASESSPYDSLLIENNTSMADFYITYGVFDSNGTPLGLFMLNLDYDQAMTPIWERADLLKANIHLLHPEGDYHGPLPNVSNNHEYVNLPISSYDQSGDFNFYTEGDVYVAYRYIEEMGRFIVITQRLSDNMLRVFIMTFLIVTLILLVIVLIVLRFFNNSSRKIIHHASIDNLTGVLNRSSYNDKISDALELCNKYNISSTLIFIDIDHFKEINDTQGHDAGDDIIKVVADMLKTTKRKDDHLFRWGGDEFAIIARCSLEDALGLSRRILNNAHDIKISDTSHVTLSIGVSELISTDNKKDCFNRADQALYHAKEQGRDQICYV